MSSAASRRLFVSIVTALLLGICVCFALYVAFVKPAPVNDCQGDSGLVVEGVTYSCEALINEAYSKSVFLDAYEKREEICRTDNNGCCETCKKVLQNKCVDFGLTIADGVYNCRALVDKGYSKYIGAYENNVTLCTKEHYSGCCKTCQAVIEKANKCKDSGLWIAGGGYECKALVDKAYSDKKRLGAYERNVTLCRIDSFRRGCCQTCETVLTNENKCTDSGLDIADGTYDCKALVDKTYSDKKKLGAYEKNVTLCNNNDYRWGCCETCQVVLKANSTANKEIDQSTRTKDKENIDKEVTDNDAINRDPLIDVGHEMKTPEVGSDKITDRINIPPQDETKDGLQQTILRDASGRIYDVEVREASDKGIDVKFSIH